MRGDAGRACCCGSRLTPQSIQKKNSLPVIAIQNFAGGKLGNLRLHDECDHMLNVVNVITEAALAMRRTPPTLPQSLSLPGLMDTIAVGSLSHVGRAPESEQAADAAKHMECWPAGLFRDDLVWRLRQRATMLQVLRSRRSVLWEAAALQLYKHVSEQGARSVPLDMGSRPPARVLFSSPSSRRLGGKLVSGGTLPVMVLFARSKLW